MSSDDSEKITPSDIQEKIEDFKSELMTISGGFSVLQRIGPSAMTLLGIFLRGSTKRKRKAQKGPIVQIQLFPNVRKYFRHSNNETEI
ncbi:hypothetical protein CL649_03255 [bacterium]|nr:hypothetical protein [bacterium]|tara:strand:+ start:176 stop:439 length:264 start_codon:yes stop_codon:yes gene_type:complete